MDVEVGISVEAGVREGVKRGVEGKDEGTALISLHSNRSGKPARRPR